MLDALADLVAPHGCGGCGLPGTRWCARCEAELRGAPLAVRLRAPVAVPVWVGGRYGGAAQRAITAYKDHGRVDLAVPLGRGLAHLLWDLVGAGELPDPLDAPLLLVPAPASRAALRRRGYDHVLDICREAAAVLAGQRPARPVVIQQYLEVTGAVRDAARLTAAERARNLGGRMRFAPGARYAPAGGGRLAPDAGRQCTVVLVDDVVTTGATMSAALEALAHGGVAPRLAVALRAA